MRHGRRTANRTTESRQAPGSDTWTPWQEQANEQFPLTSFLYGGNAAYIEQL